MKSKRDFTSGYKTYDASGGYGNSREWRDAFYTRMTGEEAREILQEQESTPLQILGLKFGATKDEIKKAYRALIMLWHPDLNPDNIEEATRRTKLINAAYAVLNPKK